MSGGGIGGDTPLAKQYQQIKAQYPGALLLFRIGDFYETFGEDAVITAGVLGIVLTKRNNGAAAATDLAGFPHHSLENYLPKLVRAGYRVAVCDQLEDPKLAKTVVKRGVTEVVTPGVAFSDQVVDHRSNNWLAAVHGQGASYGVAFLDVTTGEFLAGEGTAQLVGQWLDAHAPSELLHVRGSEDPFIRRYTSRQSSFGLDTWVFDAEMAKERLQRQLGTTGLKGFGIDDLPLGQGSAGAILHYLGETRHDRLAHINRMARLAAAEHLSLDRATIRNLELVAPIHEGARTLLQSVDRCVTPMGTRMLRRWLLFPLLDRAGIERRHERVALLMAAAELREAMGNALEQVGDVERVLGRLAAAKVGPREMLHLQRALDAARALSHELTGDTRTVGDAPGLLPPEGVADRIAATIEPGTPATFAKGGVIRKGVSPELDELRHVATHAKDMLLEIQQREAEATGITSLKVGFNNVFGYYLEVRHTHRDKVPPEWVRKQTLTGAERYITAELKDLEEKILGAEERMLVLETELYQQLIAEMVGHLRALQDLAVRLAEWDVLRGFALQALALDYCRPELHDGHAFDIRGGRHPVIEQQLPPGEHYVANDVALDSEEAQLIMITGPNMSGKSALLRQTALIALMAQAGSFVPARSARLGVLDRIFTRVGASDNLSTGESTFMVEMNETASILNNLSPRSLVLLDEIGRGTSTYDGISIAWAIAEYLHDHAHRPRTLFATHYHELNEMSATHPRIRNASVAVREVDGQVLFLRRLVAGGSDRSFGIHVARMAGMPKVVIDRARKVLAHLEASHAGDLGEAPGELPTNASRPQVQGISREPQLSIFQLDDPVLERIRDEVAAIDIDTLTPVEALIKLNEIKRISGAGNAQLRKA
ncbi:MAG: DNA mismatch repair protein MutS [Flavobacteriales bacterium]|nr:DNA mismatch repair protein MutS [Flavobacteriales bacterium]